MSSTGGLDLTPAANSCGAMSAPAQIAEFRAWAAQDPEHITLVDAGLFIRDAVGQYQWRMPCVAADEAGCAPDGTIGVRWTDEFHFCADPKYLGVACTPEYSGGIRRVSAAIALYIEELHHDEAEGAPPTSDPRSARAVTLSSS